MLAWSSRMDKKAALKKEEEKKSLQLTLLQKQILNALYASAFFKSQQQITYKIRIKKYKIALYRRKKHQLKEQHMMDLQYELNALIHQPKPNVDKSPELISKYGFFAQPKVLVSAPNIHYHEKYTPIF